MEEVKEEVQKEVQKEGYSHRVGDLVHVKITSVVDYGAFGDLVEGGSGLVHISEIDRRFIANVADYLPVGSIHEVKIIALGKKEDTYALSLKRVSRRPRQKVKNFRKPMSRKEANRYELDSVPFDEMKKALPGFIEEEYARLGAKNAK